MNDDDMNYDDDMMMMIIIIIIIIISSSSSSWRLMTMTIMMLTTDICHRHLLLRPQCLKNLISPILLLFYSKVSELCHCNQKHNDNFAVRVISLSLPMPWHLEPFKWYGVNLIPAWISNYVHYKEKLIYSFPNFSATVKVLEWEVISSHTL